MSKISVQRQVRQRDRFLCAACRKEYGEQYAHIIPDENGGTYDLNNLDFLCYRCHQDYEAAIADPKFKQKLIDFQTRVRDAPKKDDVLAAAFNMIKMDDLIVNLGGGFSFSGYSGILMARNEGIEPYIKLETDEIGRLFINARLEDEDGKILTEIRRNKISFDTATALDFVLERRGVQFKHKNQKVKPAIKQKVSGEIFITGSLFINSGYFKITNNRIYEPLSHNVMSRNRALSTGQELRKQGLLIGLGIMAI